MYLASDVRRHQRELAPVDFIVRARLVRMEHLVCLNLLRRQMRLVPGRITNLLRHDDLLLCTALQRIRRLFSGCAA
jgi:hypothetical protein